MKDKETTKTIITLSAAAAASCFLFRNAWPLLASLLLLATLFTGEKLPRSIARLWKTFALSVGAFNAKVLLFITYYLFLTPIALLYRLFNRDEAGRFNKDDRASMFEAAGKIYDKDAFRKLW
jgi:hypothetical protein